MSIINMQTMRYINLLDNASKVKTRKCFIYNNAIIFAVPRAMMSKAIGPDAMHVRAIQEKLGKRVRIIREAEGLHDAHKFIEDIVSPVRFKSLEMREGSMILTSGSQSTKAALIGRNKRRLEELSQIVEDSFGMSFRII